MKFILAFILGISFSYSSVGQDFPKAIVDSFCNETINYYYTDFSKPLDSIEALNYRPKNAYILKSHLTKNLRTEFNEFTVRYLTQQEALEEISKTDSKTGALEKLFVTQLQDTINIDIGWLGCASDKGEICKRSTTKYSCKLSCKLRWDTWLYSDM